MIMYQIDDLYGADYVIFPTLDDAMDAIRDEIECGNMFPGELTLTIKLIEMTQAEFDALPQVDI